MYKINMIIGSNSEAWMGDSGVKIRSLIFKNLIFSKTDTLVPAISAREFLLLFKLFISPAQKS